MKKLYDMCVVTSSYSHNGQTKNHYENIGAIFKNDKGNNFAVIKAHFNPAAIQRKEGSDSILVSLFPPKDKDNGNQQRSSSQDDWDESSLDDSYNNDSNIPF